MVVDQMIANLIVREGGYSDNPDDTGKITCWGITEATARRNGYTGAMRDLTRDMAAFIYRQEYLIKPGFDKVLALSSPIAEELFDTGVNMGIGIPGPWLQRWLNAFNQGGALYGDISVDGSIGPATISALRAFLAHRGADGERVLVNALNCSQGARYLDITEGRAANEGFVFGWLLNRVRIA